MGKVNVVRKIFLDLIHASFRSHFHNSSLDDALFSTPESNEQFVLYLSAAVARFTMGESTRGLGLVIPPGLRSRKPVSLSVSWPLRGVVFSTVRAGVSGLDLLLK